jgi:hypothetical protein
MIAFEHPRANKWGESIDRTWIERTYWIFGSGTALQGTAEMGETVLTGLPGAQS